MLARILDVLKLILPRMFLLILVFYLIYPQALDVRGSSFISASGVVGILLYALHRFPFRKEVISVLFVFACYIAFCVYSASINGIVDPFVISFLRSQMGFFFTAYIIIFLMFRIHKNPRVEILVIYIVSAVVLQCILTLLMYFNEGINDFLYSLQLQADLDEEKKEMAEGDRLIGYGAVFFGAGIVAGYALILIMYVIVRVKMNIWGIILIGVSYSLVFFVGIFSARTTIIGLAVSLVTFVVLFLFDDNPYKRQGFKTIGIMILFVIIGVSLSFQYFPNYTDWAFEMFYTYQHTGTLQTKSSDGLLFMLYAPNDFKTFMLGSGSMDFFGSDVGYTRLVFYIGAIGTFLYFFFPFYVGYKSRTKDWGVNFLLLILFVYNLVMNIKGLTDLNMVFYLFFFFFLFYKYYYFYPKVYPTQKATLQNLKYIPDEKEQTR